MILHNFTGLEEAGAHCGSVVNMLHGWGGIISVDVLEVSLGDLELHEVSNLLGSKFIFFVTEVKSVHLIA